MSNLLLCHGKMADKPYNVTGLSVNVYSAEELCYVLAQNAHTLDRDFMVESLCSFIGEQLGLKELAAKLREIIEIDGSLTDFVTAILTEVAYCDQDEIRNVKQILIDSSGLSPARKHKSRGDNLLKARRYARALDEYRGTLDRIDPDAEPVLYASVLHNTGTAYARLLTYEKAAECYLEAYRLSMDDETLKLYLVCCRIYMDDDEYKRMLIRCGYPQDIINEAEQIVAKRTEYRDPQNSYVKELEELKALKKEGRISSYYIAVDQTIDSWKNDYRMEMILH